MKILAVRSLLSDNGPGTQPLTLALALRDRGHETVFVTAGGANVGNVRAAGFAVHLVPELAPDRHNPLAIARALWRLAGIVGEARPDVIHGHNAAATLCAYTAGLLRGRNVPCVTSVRGVEERASHQWRNAIWRNLPGVLLAVCDNTRLRLRDFGVAEGRIRVTYNGVDQARFDPAKHDRAEAKAALGLANKVVVGCVGAMVPAAGIAGPTKGQHVLIRAVAGLLGEFPDLALLLVGDGSERGGLEVLAADLGIADRVHFAGRRFDVPQLLSAMDIFALPSIFGEFFPNAILEAMAMGLPWVGSDIAGLGELTAGNRAGWVSAPGDVYALKAKLRALLNDTQLRQQRSIAARHEVEQRFCVTQVTDRVLAAYTLAGARA